MQREKAISSWYPIAKGLGQIQIEAGLTPKPRPLLHTLLATGPHRAAGKAMQWAVFIIWWQDAAAGGGRRVGNFVPKILSEGRVFPWDRRNHILI